ncbi:MAG: hypothetical protein IRZ33_06055 [Alicyclobacillaceae bacterium]|nr:hypothetical protein [Alicyclobacillaceae bacterium]
MGKSRSVSGGGRRTLLIPDRPAMPDVCWVLLPTLMNASSVSVSLLSLASQLQRQPSTRRVRKLELVGDMLRVELEPQTEGERSLS